MTDESEKKLIKKILSYEQEIEKAAADCAPHHIARFAYDIASDFHSFYSRCRIIGVDEELASARLALLRGTAHVIEHALGILGVSAPDKM